MRTIMFSLAIVLLGLKAAAQNDTLPAYRKFPKIPEFSCIRVPDSSLFTSKNLRKRKATIIMLFSPDCGHCQHQTRELEAKIDSLKNVQIVMVSFLDYSLIRKFYSEYNIADYPNISVARDTKYFFGKFYNLKQYPSLFLYNKKHKLVAHFEGNVSVSKLMDAL